MTLCLVRAVRQGPLDPPRPRRHWSPYVRASSSYRPPREISAATDLVIPQALARGGAVDFVRA